MVATAVMIVIAAIGWSRIPCELDWITSLCLLTLFIPAGWGAASIESYIHLEIKNRRKNDTESWREFRKEFEDTEGGNKL